MSKVESNFESPEKKPSARRKKAKTLEFDFALDPVPARAPSPSPETKKVVNQVKPLDLPAAPRMESAPKKESGPDPVRASASFSNPRTESTPIKENIPMTPSKPSPVNVRSSIERQSREQRAVGTMLNGVAIAFICGIVLVASLASLGGYVLFKQIRNQSATIALLESNTRERIDNLQSELAQKDAELAAALKENSLRMTNMQGEFEVYRNKTSQSIAQLASANAKLEQRLAAFRQDFNRQDALLTEYRRNR